MQFENKVAVITGAASGIGLGLAEQAARRGMSLVLADIEETALHAAEDKLRASGVKTLAVVTDVSQAEQVEALADRAFDAFGSVGLLCNNAGVQVAVTRPVWRYSLGDWEWLMGVNLWGAIHGVRAFLPRMMQQDIDSHILNTSSAAGVIAGPGLAVYKVTKHGVLSLSESLYHDLRLANAPVGVSVFCPDVVKTGLRTADRNRPASLRDEKPRTADEEAAEKKLGAAPGLQPAEAAELAFRGMEGGRFYLFTNPDNLDYVHQRVSDMETGVPKPATTLRDDLDL
ncbi:MAG: SDR family NAD(P)-dependent oxidoreductase [Myxococcota bacterium]|nr:SDR family NAD(P)-dependent oxidoreductase [Myxococcota bacterium]